jgi:hypothetical protein
MVFFDFGYKNLIIIKCGFLGRAEHGGFFFCGRDEGAVTCVDEGARSRGHLGNRIFFKEKLKNLPVPDP